MPAPRCCRAGITPALALGQAGSRRWRCPMLAPTGAESSAGMMPSGSGPGDGMIPARVRGLVGRHV